MTDTEDDVLSSNVYSFPNNKRTIHNPKGPNYTNISCRNNFLTTSMHLPRNFERRNLNYDQRSLYHKRDTSPMSLRSVPDFIPWNFRQPYSTGAASYQRSIINGRSCSPKSVRSIDTNVSMSATDIALAINNEAYNKRDLKLIKEALNRQFKSRIRRRVEKRWNRRFHNMSKQKSGYDSGEQASDSSISSDDCRSIQTAPCLANSSKYQTTVNSTNFNVNANKGYMYNDRTTDMRKKSLRNVICSYQPPTQVQNSFKDKQVIHPNNENGVLGRDRFKSGCLLASQRFNNSVTEPLSSNLSRINSNNVHSNQIINAKQKMDTIKEPKDNLSEDMESEQEEIFSEITTIERTSQIVNNSHKRTMDKDELHCNPQKKSKVTSTQLHNSSDELNCIQNDVGSDFVFAKPKMPVRKSVNKKKELQSPEKLLAKSRQPLFDFVEDTRALSPVKSIPIQNLPKLPDVVEINEKRNSEKESVKPSHSSDDLSMQPSFIKRKLFTQNLDMAEKKNISDSSLSSSPQVKNVNQSKEKSKARKLASSQSCLRRDDLDEDSNFLDLIHKIVPADQINVTNATNKNACNRNSQRDSNDKWDVTSVISSCLDKDISDTYTDEEIFKVVNNDVNKSKFNTNTRTKIQSQLASNCKIVLKQIPPNQENKLASNTPHKQTTVKKAKEFNKENTNVIKTFWDTDSESELENYNSSCNLNDSENNNTVNKSGNKDNNCKKLQSHKAECNPVKATRSTRTRNKSQNSTNIKTTTGAGIKKSTKTDKRNISQESKENNNNLLNISLSSDNIQKTNKPIEPAKTVTLINHRTARPKRQIKPKKIFTIESPSPKDLNISIKEKEKPTETVKPTANVNRRTGRNKSQVKSNKINPVESPSSKDTDNSNSDLNISIKSLRSYNKSIKVNEKVVARNLKSRNRSGVKGI